ncbi:unnamed protein product [Rhizoctonia solani]|uniref:Uncharacterized protein n=1 Tax=Rhizoctonia solani TaxID=456999 RepID=A0A8H3A1U2_9AGAM|nr:unnamed protein product [Rhizoctonia solani]
MSESDFKTKLERKAFDKATEDSFWRLCWSDNVESFILHDGNTRVWCVQTVVENAVGSAKLATNVYAGGTAFYGAWLFRQFGTKPVKVHDTVVRVVDLGYTAENQGKDDLATHPRVCSRLGAPDPHPEPSHHESYSAPHQVRNQARNNLTLKHKQNLNVVVGFHEPAGHPSANITTMQYTIMGVKAAYNNITERGATDAGVRLYFESEIKNLFSGGSSGTLATESSTASASEETEVEDKPKKPVEKDELIAVTLILEPVTVNLMFLDEKMADRKLLQLLSLNYCTEIARGDETSIQDRSKEAKTGPQALKDPEQTTFTAKIFVSLAQDNCTRIDAFNALLESDHEGDHEPLGPSPNLPKAYRGGRVAGGPYLNERVNVQKSLPKYAHLVLVTAKMKSSGIKLQSVVRRLTRGKPKVKAAKKKTEEDGYNEGGPATEDNPGKDRR